MSYTKGKWGFYKHDIGEYSGHIESDLGNHNVRTIATILAYAEKEECLANAKLIASAPELLNLLKKIDKFGSAMLQDDIEQAIAKTEEGW